MNLMSRLLRRLGSILGAICVFVFTIAVIPEMASAAACVPVITTDGLYSVASFKTVGTCEWTVPSTITEVTYLIVGGGGGGASGGGGGGGVITNHGVSTLTVTPNAVMSIVVGAGGINGGGGSGNSIPATSGGNSTFGTFTAVGGGYGGTASRNPADGGSGGGGGYDVPGQRRSLGTAGQGNSGGRSNQGGYGAAGGGGGAGGVGANAPAQHLGGAGGIGVSSMITGSSVPYGGGGGGGVNANCGCNHPNSGGVGGSGGGGNGSSLGYGGGAYFNGTSGAANTGGGGGGTDPESTLAGNGGSGIVIVRYLAASAPSNSAVPVVSGTTRTGSTLTATSGTWTGSPTFAYQWQRAATSGGSFTNIPSAISSLYDLTDADIDKYIRVSVVATNSVGSTTVLSAATSIVVDLPDSDVPTATTPVATATGFTFTILNYSNLYTYALTTTNGSVTRSLGDVTVSGLVAGESATVTIAVTRANYKSASKTVTGSAIPAPTTAPPALSIEIQAPATTIAQGQASVATLAPTTTVVGRVVIVSSTTTVKPKTVASTTTVPAQGTTTSVAAPKIAQVATGQSAVQVDGVDTKAQISRVNNQLVVSAGALKATIGGINENGSAMSLDSDGNVRLRSGDVVRIKLAGFKPGSTVEAWLFSTPVLMGTSVVGVDGSVTGNFVVPKNASQGAHRIAVVAKAVDGKPTTFTVGVAVGVVSETSTWTRVLIAIPIALAIGFGFLLPNQLRRRRKGLSA